MCFEMEKTDCTCPKVECERHGFCDECKENHYSKNKLPYCERQENL
jgi:hypothetical protein